MDNNENRNGVKQTTKERMATEMKSNKSPKETMGQMTPRENALIAYRHGTPAWIPCFYTDMLTIMAHPEMERYNGFGSGKDYFDVERTYVPEHRAPMPTPGKVMLDDICRWKSLNAAPNSSAP